MYYIMYMYVNKRVWARSAGNSAIENLCIYYYYYYTNLFAQHGSWQGKCVCVCVRERGGGGGGHIYIIHAIYVLPITKEACYNR